MAVTSPRSQQERACRASLAAPATGAAPRPSQWSPPPGSDSRLQRVGVSWDAVRAPSYLGDRAYALLAEGQGAVIRDPYRHDLYWLVRCGAAAVWEPLLNIDVYGPACWLEVPPVGRTRGLGPHWARPPKAVKWLLTDPGQLHAALVQAIASASASSEAAR